MLYDVVGSYERLEKIYRMYIASAFPLKNGVLSRERDRLLNSQEILSQPPLVETVPIYPLSGKTLTAAATSIADISPAYRDLQVLAAGLFSDNMELYKHQWQALSDTIVDGKDIVVTTGTGSGKTEAFLLPLLAEFARESKDWEPAESEPRNRLWWNSGPRVPQWSHFNRPAALRALILYPLNALVEDQLRRLRMTLDSEELHGWLDTERGGNRITFGRYTGLTPLSGSPESGRIEQLRSELRQLEASYDAITDELRNAPNNEERQRLQEALWYFANPKGGEMWSRWDMQDTPPDVLITNYSMLNIMLMRRIEQSIFDETRTWLEDDPLRNSDRPSRIFHLIVDELHAYRGTPGTEVAYILRLLFDRLGLAPDSPQLRILTTTASLTDSSDGRKFLREFFGRDNFSFISEEQVEPPLNAHKRLRVHRDLFAEFSRRVNADATTSAMRPIDATSPVTQLAMERLAAGLSPELSLNELAPEYRLGEALNEIGAHEALRDACREKNRSVRPTRVPDLDEILFGGNGKSEAIHGLLLALGLAKRTQTDRSPQPVRGHLFFHNLLNLWACSNPNCTDAKCIVDERQNDPPTIGALYANHLLSCSCGSRVLDFIVCEVCGEVYLGGYKHVVPGGYILTADEPNLEGIPDRVSHDRTYVNYAVVWPARTDGMPQPQPFQHRGLRREWKPGRLDTATGRLRIGSGAPTLSEVAVWVYYMNPADERVLYEPAMPGKCPSCEADYRRRNNPSPLRNHRTGFQKSCQVLAGGLMREMPEADRKQRKLVIFSDSRQDSAKLAAGMERDHYRDVVRMALIQSLNDFWGNLAAFLRYRTRRTEVPPELKSINSGLYSDVVSGPHQGDEVRQRRFASHDAVLRSEARLWLLQDEPESTAHRDEWLQLLRDYGSKIPLRHVILNIYPRLLGLGINPAGTSYRVTQYKGTVWYECFDWDDDPVTPVPSNSRSSEQETLLARIEYNIIGEIMYAIFPHMARSLEGLGQGWVTYNSTRPAKDRLYKLANAVIRQLGGRRRHKYADHIYFDSPEETLPRFVREYTQSVGVDEADLIHELSSANAIVPSSSGFVLNPDQLFIMPPQEPENGRRAGYRCQVCNAFYLQPTLGECPDCLVPLFPDETRQDYDYYTYLSEESGHPFRMNSDELTGQTDKEDRPVRQRKFQEIFISDERALPEGIDLLSVTTTMEAGVDIGGLLAVLMANMPPRRFNYQQRVGRAGRRGTGVSLAVTFCRDRSHDDFYYLRPESMTGDAPPSPYVDLSSEAIIQRVIVKEVLRQAFDETRVHSLYGGTQGDSVHGEFGDVGNWETYRPEIENWLHDPGSNDALVNIVRSLTVETVWENNADFESRILNKIRYELPDAVSEIARDDERFSQTSLSERLANAGLLPMFGFPTRVRNLYTKWPRRGYPWPPEHDTVSRDLDIAISQFAPFSQTVKDKQIHTSVGVVSFKPLGKKVQTLPGFIPPLPYENTKIGRCNYCQAVVPSPDGTDLAPILSDAGLPPSRCPVCGEDELYVVDAREPRDFFSSLQAEDFEGQFEWQPRSSRPTISFRAQHAIDHIANAVVAAAEEDVLSMNDSGHRGGFVFHPAAILDHSGRVIVPENAGAFAVELEDEPTERIALGAATYRVALLSKRHTEILLVGINKWPQGVYSDPTTVNGKYSGRAAWYSFAFWLRIAAAALLDVDADELQAGIRTFRTPDGRVAAEAFLSDKLENGAGYCRYLGQPKVFEQILDQSLTNADSIAVHWIDDEHWQCDTSCNMCLRDYGNLAYHGLLDWRLALDMARLARGDDRIDLVTDWTGKGNPWQRTLTETNAIPSMLRKLGYGRPETFGQLRGYVHNRHQKVKLEVHPLWNETNRSVAAALAAASERYPRYDVGLLNPFRAIRRPSDYV